MLNTFPALLVPFLAPLILRSGVAIAFFAIAYWGFSRRAELSQLALPVIGRNSWWVWLSVVAHTVVGILLLFGYHTQVMAILGALLAIKSAVWHRRFPLAFPLSRAASLLVLLICLSLVVSGAGLHAFDIYL